MSEIPLTPVDLGHFIEDGGVDAELVAPALETPTVPAAAQALGISPTQIVKTLLFEVRGQAFLVIAMGDRLVDRRVLADRFGVGKKQIKLADAEHVLRLTGYPVGGVPPFGHRSRVPALIDRAIQAWDVVYGGGGDDRTLMRIAPAELARVVQGEWIDLAPDTAAEP